MVATLIAPGVFEMCHYLCEIQNTMMNFYEEPEAMHELIEYITEWELKWAEQICTYMKPDVVFHHLSVWTCSVNSLWIPTNVFMAITMITG